MSSSLIRACVVYYHHVGEVPDYRFVTVDELRNQALWLLNQRKPATLDEINLADMRFSLTFDDGYDDVRGALPLLDELNIRATFFVLPLYFGKVSRVTTGYPSRHLSRADIKFLHSEGHQIGSHGLEHRDLTQLDSATLQEELLCSQALLEEIMGAKVHQFAYPYGLCNEDVVRECLKHYRDAWSTGSEKARRGGAGSGARPRCYLQKLRNYAYEIIC
jgi:peptidoglycan/xylan/chitin deacetylase (PgdA/CDA1 family)